MDILDMCIDEIALEGLDGISIKTLWERLVIREPPIGLNVSDEHVKRYLWRGIRPYSGVTFHHVQVPWKDPVVRTSFESDDIVNGLYRVNEDEREQESHPVCLIRDGLTRGSCATYHQREDVTSTVRDKSLDLDDLEKIYRGNFVIVANQNEREKALFGPVNQNTIKTEVSDAEYILVERVGRSRRAGEVPMKVSDDSGMGIRTDKKSQFYYRKRMIQANFLRSHPFVYHCGDTARSSGVKSTCIIFLTRFARPVCNRMSDHLHKMADYLQSCCHHIEDYVTLRTRMDVSVKFFKQMLSYHKYFSVEFQPISMFYVPNDDTEKEKIDMCKDGRVRTIRCVRLIKHPKDCTDEDEDEDVPEVTAPIISTTCYNRSVAHDAYAKLVNAGPDGLSISQFQEVFNVDNKSARAIVRSLCRSGYVFYYIMDKHKQRLMKIVARCYEDSCHMKRWTDTERDGLEKLIKSEDIVKEEDEDGPKPKKPRKSQTEKKQNTTVVSMTISRKSAEQTEEESASDKNFGAVILPKSEEDNESVLEEEQRSPAAEVVMEITTDEDHVVNQITRRTDVKDVFSYDRNARLVSAKYLSRARYILEAVKEQQVVEHVYRLRKEITELEKTDGHAAILDPKVMQRIINSLQESGQVRSVKTVIRVGDKEKKIHILCDPSVDPTTDSRVQAVFDKARLELTKQTGEKHMSSSSTPTEETPAKRKAKPKIIPQGPFDVTLARRYGSLPKMKQLEALHKYLYYCMYGYEGIKADHNYSFEQGPMHECRVYKDEYTFKRFIPPIPKRHGFEADGWFLVGDIIWAMPLVTFCQLVHVCYEIPELTELLADPVKKYVPLFRQDGPLTQLLMYRRNHIFRILRLLTQMCHMGLLSFGPAIMKEKDQSSCFLHRHATLFDTTKSERGYCRITEGLDYPKSNYTFNTYSDVDDYWNDLQFVCMNTQLGALKKDTAQPEKFDYKPFLTERTQALKPYSDPKKVCEVRDIGEMPGDNLGAAGLDSSFFAHRKSNWTHGTLNPFSMKDHYKDPTKQLLMKQPIAKLMKRLDRKDISKPIHFKSPKKAKKPVQTGKKEQVGRGAKAVRPSTSTADDGAQPGPSGLSTASGRAHIHRAAAKKKPSGDKGPVDKKNPTKLQPRPFVPKKKTPMHSTSQIAKDKDALKRMRTLRVRWTTGEDNMLLWFKIGHLFLGYHEVIMSWPDLRDILNKHFPNVSMDKTSKACARRLLFMCRNPNTTRTINLLANQALHSEVLVKKYNDCRIKNKEVVRAEKFDQLITDLRTMLRSAPTDTKLPDTLEELEAQYDIQSCDVFTKPDCTVHKDAVTIQDVCESTLHSLIHSTVWLGDNRESRSVDLFKVYKQYPDELLNIVCRRMVNDRMITKLKVTKAAQTCTLTSMKSYQLSQRYQYMLVHMTHHPQTMFDQIVAPYGQLCSGFEQGTRTEIDCTDRDDAGMTINMVTYTALRKLIYTVNIPEHLIVVEMGKDAENDLKAGNVPPAQTQSDDEDDELITELTGKSASTSVESWNSNKDTLKCNLKDMKLTHASRFLLSMARHHHFRSLQEKKQKLSSHDVLAVKPCELRVRFKKNVKQQPSLVPAELVKNILRRMEDTQPETVDYNLFLARCRRSLSYQESVDIDKLHKSICIYKHVGMTRHELVTLCPDLMVLDRRLSILLTNRIVLKVGVTTDRYVSHLFIRPWLVHAYRSRPAQQSDTAQSVNSSDDNVRLDDLPIASTSTSAQKPNQSMDTTEPQPSTSTAPAPSRSSPRRPKKPARVVERVRLVCRPWRYPEGPIHKSALKRFLEAVMLSILAKPGSSAKALDERFDPILQPVQLRDLLNVLAQVGCLRIQCFERVAPCTLFSARQTVSLATFDDDRGEKVYVPTVDAIVRLSQLLGHIDKWESGT